MSKLREKLETFSKTHVPPKGVKGKTKGMIADPCNAWMNRDKKKRKLSKEHAMQYAEFLAYGIGQAFIDQFHGGEQAWRIRPSDQKCSRASALKKLGFDEGIPPDKDGTFFVGHMAEAYSKVIARAAGCNVTGFNRKLTIPVPGHTCEQCGGVNECSCGEQDGALIYGKGIYVVDWKSISAKGWPYLAKNFATDAWGYHKQLKTYMMAKEYEDENLKGALLVYSDKGDWNRWREFFIPVPTEEDREKWFTHCAVVSNSTLKKLPKKPSWATVRKTYINTDAGRKDIEKLEDIRCCFCSCKSKCMGSGWYAREGKQETIRDV